MSEQKARDSSQKGKSKEEAHPQSRLSASEAPGEQGYSHAWESDDWSCSQWPDDFFVLQLLDGISSRCLDGGTLFESCPPSDTRGSGSGLHTIDWIETSNRKIQKHSWYYGFTTEFCLCIKSFVFANSETETCFERRIIHFPTTQPCSTVVNVLATGDVPILSSLPQMRYLGITIELDPRGDKITCPAFGLFSSPADYSTMGHIVLGLTSLTYQPTSKSSNRSDHPRRHEISAMSMRKPAYPAHALDMHEDEDEVDKPCVRPTTRKEPLEEGRDQAMDDEDLAPSPRPSRLPQATATELKGTTSMAGSNCYTGTRGVEGLARANKGDLDIGQKGRK